MNPAATRRIATVPRSSRGFALIIVVSLLALLVLALVSLATLTRIEAQVGMNSRKQALAQQNARFALEQALGELQRHAGLDTRVTATAEVVGVTNANKHWAGVWNSSGGSALTWLVSGNENGTVAYDPQTVSISFPASPTALSQGIQVADEAARLLVGPKSAGSDSSQFVAAPLVELKGPVAGESSEGAIGRYAWWVGDEGVKAKANIRDAYSVDSATAEEQALRRTVAQRVGIEQLVPGYPANDEGLNRVIDRNQLPFVGGLGLSDIRDHFHDLTTHARGVLSDVSSGGLRKDLSRVLSEAPAGFADNDLIGSEVGEIDGDPKWGVLRAFYSQRFGAVADVAPFASSGMVQGIHPLVTAMSIWPGVTLEGVGTRLHLTCRATISIANPYDVPIQGTAYTIIITPASTLSVSYRKNIGASTHLIDGLEEPVRLASLPSSGSLRFSTPPLSFAPGEVKILSTSYESSTLQWAVGAIPLAEGNPVGVSGTFEYFSIRDYAPEPPATEIFAPNESAAIMLNGGRLDFTFGMSDGTVLQSVEDIQITGDSEYRYIAQETMESGEDTPYSHDAIGTGFTAYMRGASGIAATQNLGDGTTNNIRWLASHSPRAPVLRRAIGDPWTENPLWDGVRILRDTTQEPVPLRDLAQSLWGRSFESDVGSPSVALYHMLRREPISLGEFQHASFSADASLGFQLASFPVGNSYASPYVPVNRKDLSFGLNEALFDEFFLSGFLDNGFPNSPLPNQRLRKRNEANAPALTFRNVAAFLLCDGAFNVNSTSEAAWAALLSSLNGIEDPNSPGTLLDRPFFRTPHPTDVASNTTAGVVSLNETTIDSLASNIVAQVRVRGPFRSLASFVNRRRPSLDNLTEQADLRNGMGVLQAAVDSTSGLQPEWTKTELENLPSLPYPQAGVGATGANLSGWLSQADILTALGPVLAVRSDTFLVRAYGETVNPVTDEVEARAWCEAVVQRVPEYLVHDANEDTDDSNGDAPWQTPLNSINQTFGRRFVITSFRWLSPDDI